MKRIILLALCFLSAFSIVLTAALIHFSMYWGFSQRMKREAAIELEFARAGISSAGSDYLTALAPSGAPNGAPSGNAPLGAPRLTLLDSEGSVLFDSVYDAESMENHADRPEVRAALDGKAGENFRFSNTLEKQTYYRTLPLEGGGALRIAVSMDSISASALDLLPLTMLITLLTFICAVAGASRITGRIVRPINALNLETPEENDIYDELSPLLSRIKSQNDQLERRIAQLRKKRLEFEAITNNMREGLVLLDRDARVLLCNESAVKLLGVHAGVGEGQNALCLRRDEPFRAALERALGGAAAECSLSAGAACLRLMASPVMDGGRIQGAVLLLLDVTEREDRERLRREFSANVSHELKTPLTVISGYAELLSRGVAGAEDAAAFGGKIYAESQRLVNIINDVMQLSRLDEGAVTLERVNLFALVSEALERAAPVARSRGVGLSASGEDVFISGVPQILREMVFNLVDNGIKYNHEGGAVRVSLVVCGGAARLCVEDNGLGIPPAEQERVFERFYRVDKSRNTSTGGTGLGLSIVKHGAQLHGASIELESDGISGTRICLTFPKL